MYELEYWQKESKEDKIKEVKEKLIRLEEMMPMFLRRQAD